MDEATRLFSKVFFSLSGAFLDTLSFRQMVLTGLPDVQRQLFEHNVRWFGVYVNDPENDAIFLDKAKFLQSVGGVAGAATSLTEQEIRMYQGSIDAASLVFMHSTLDGAAEDLCRVTAMIDPKPWYEFTDDQKESLGVLRTRGYESVAMDRIQSILDDGLSREPLIRKIRRLFQVCRPDRSYSRKGYQYDEERLIALDLLRHDIVHRERPRGPIQDAAAGIEYMHETGQFLFGMVNHRYGVRIDSEYLKTRDP